jgi:hypothetical protein
LTGKVGRGNPIFIDRLTEAGIQAIVEGVVGAALAVGTALIARNLARREKVWVGIGAGRTCMSPYVLLVGLLSGAAAMAFLVLGLLEPESLRERGALYAWMALIGGFSLGFVGIIPLTRHTWEWDETGLRWQGAMKSVAIAWPELSRVGKSWDGRFYAADKAGRKIYWSTYTLEHQALGRVIEAARPDLTPP